jgi:glutamyl-tRNA reductase
MVDIAVPRDIEPQVGELRDVYLYSVDDLREIVDENLRTRQNEARKADQIIEQGVSRFLTETRSLAAVDSVREYRSMAEQVREQELQRALRAIARGDDPQQVAVQLARAITNKLIHAPTAGLKAASAAGREDLLAGARRLLGLPDTQQELPEADAADAAPDADTRVATDTDDASPEAGRTLQ